MELDESLSLQYHITKLTQKKSKINFLGFQDLFSPLSRYLIISLTFISSAGSAILHFTYMQTHSNLYFLASFVFMEIITAIEIVATPIITITP
jgi:hypothetical protein